MLTEPNLGALVQHRDRMRNVFQEMLTSLPDEVRQALQALDDLHGAELALLRAQPVAT